MFKVILAGAGLLLSTTTLAEQYKDYERSREISTYTFVNVKQNKLDEYLLGLKQTWLSTCEEQKKLGKLVDCQIFVGSMGPGGTFNMMLVQKAPSAAATDPDEASYRKLQSALQARLAEDKRNAIVANYENIRTTVGVQEFRQITFK